VLACTWWVPLHWPRGTFLCVSPGLRCVRVTSLSRGGGFIVIRDAVVIVEVK
jgi:hypothetical protein